VLDLPDDVAVLGRDRLRVLVVARVIVLHVVLGERDADDDGLGQVARHGLELLARRLDVLFHRVDVAVGCLLGCHQHQHVTVCLITDQLVPPRFECVDGVFLVGILSPGGGRVDVGIADERNGLVGARERPRQFGGLGGVGHQVELESGVEASGPATDDGLDVGGLWAVLEAAPMSSEAGRELQWSVVEG
jgi:hypothetical protein